MANRKQSRRGLRFAKWLPRSRWQRMLLAVAGAFVLLGALAFLRLYTRCEAFLAERPPGAIRVYSDSLVLRAGLDVEGVRLAQRLRRLGYTEASGGAAPEARHIPPGGRPLLDLGAGV